MSTLFTKILNHELPGHFVYEDEKCGVFLSIAPIGRGHLLVVPRSEVDHWIDLSSEDMNHCTAVAQKMGKVLMKTFNPTKVGVLIAGLEVPHTHIHLIPIITEADLFKRPQEVSQEELAQTAALIRQNI
ncbi:MAG: HIT family protein [Candidatus Bruticola sp.]